MKIVRNRKTGEEMTVLDFANKMVDDILNSRLDPIKVDQMLWGVEDFCRENGLTYYKDPLNYDIEIY